MPRMSLAYAIYFECPRCGHQIDVGESTQALTRDSVKALATEQGRRKLEGICPGCQTSVAVGVSVLQSRARN